ncbi:Branched-chain alpha-keto acid dehydrogenase, E1 component, alpha subunit [Brochothrix thermosphacta]|uniref:2-oxoisovalerate dehydrogenase subunit alpha n=2 Tax=Brochothrix thermosphacta TaxID=2756 RepID=A0A2X0QP21_BROTH|nr:Branched-chain alpha-keto acid dehydrogenase, E1 component, alpha subunit [Brachybacterium faecium]SOC28655.1 branched-chain alpha-keto acid dehydrogenase E1 subunit [Brochothrix thermosphacta]SPN72332.1 Branched-chain alpha-keto acid dehydrogenase, E1 component, alpha subunit [Brochothrix thermosphacta]SPN76778.1 Branched-chain alpha-keto acid dehydrogenase, E1 component, alpha subunit [Brochothrix thermosphacta]SPP25562.1 Branched-chain alpha-keto acid dehydrogenase, E1 component, alpha su
MMLKDSRVKKASLKDMELDKETLLEMYEVMLMARRVDERIWLLNRSGKIPFNISGQGQEGAQVASAFAFNREIDYTLPYYRDLAVVLAFGMTAKEVLLSAFGKAEDPNSGGRQMPAHYGHKAHRIVTQSSPVTTQFPHAAGIALAAKMRKDPIVAYTSCGEGSSNQGDFHEGINFASVHRLPVVFVIENNQYAISVPKELQFAADKLSDRAIGYGIPGETVDGNDMVAVYLAFKRAVTRARDGEGPTLIETVTYRFTPHSSDDDDRSYRTREEVEAARGKDPLDIYFNQLLDEKVATQEELDAIEARVKAEIQEATEYAENAAAPAVETLGHHVYDEDTQGGN